MERKAAKRKEAELRRKDEEEQEEARRVLEEEKRMKAYRGKSYFLGCVNFNNTLRKCIGWNDRPT